MKERLGITPHMDKTLASDRRRYLQLARALLKRDLVTVIEVDERDRELQLLNALFVTRYNKASVRGDPIYIIRVQA